MTISQSLTAARRPTPAHEIDIELFTFIERYATNLARWDLLIFFGQHPATPANAPAISKQIGRATRSIQKELDDLVYLGILRANRNDGVAQYSLTRTPAARRAVMRLARDYTTKP